MVRNPSTKFIAMAGLIRCDRAWWQQLGRRTLSFLLGLKAFPLPTKLATDHILACINVITCNDIAAIFVARSGWAGYDQGR